ncbi:GyrI-like domain-containing protein [Lentiprolixibacter aurantiacus]|uniref:GyrI-like domain-containing protein n=1 Tax=Lentiprolixibacter aurantiacus TaxID=2993939 RepID=A0AAE3MLG9_9FLAO|nr:GyrI-like domain-containing protein [Lentiprolixibacter aurantiacus]MCX2720010.1 GyrI-like domain-containing protein [Lentiprolixibacter aurantiacus]
MNSRIIKSNTLLLAGQKTTMSLSDNKTLELWQGFMPVIKGVKELGGTELYSVEIYPEDYFSYFSPHKEFEKWAAAPVKDAFEPDGSLKVLEIQAGLYAVFHYKGKSSEAHKAYQYIFEEWMPASGYEVDNRPHFAVMGEKYRNDHPDSEEELWVPIKKSALL